jgi:hypothetical protein
MDLYTFISVLIIPFVILHFTLDYLSDSQITHSEIEIGIIQLLHHIVSVIQMCGFFVVPFIKVDINIMILLITINTVAHIGYLQNKGKCWIVSHVNKIINPNKPNRKWISNGCSYIKHYTRGGEWAYSDIINDSNYKMSASVNIAHLFSLLKYIC